MHMYGADWEGVPFSDTLRNATQVDQVVTHVQTPVN